jgi:hypothetical protein
MLALAPVAAAIACIGLLFRKKLTAAGLSVGEKWRISVSGRDTS